MPHLRARADAVSWPRTVRVPVTWRSSEDDEKFSPLFPSPARLLSVGEGEGEGEPPFEGELHMRRPFARVLWSSILIIAAGGAGCSVPRPQATTDGPSRRHEARRIAPSAEEDALALPLMRRDAASTEGLLFQDAAVLDADELRCAVLQRNPNLAALRSAWTAAIARYPQATALDDPMLAYGFAPQSIGSSKVDYGQDIELSQKLPWPGKLRLRGEAALADAESSRQAYEALRLETALAATFLFYDYYVLDRADEINDEHVRLLTELKRAATEQYAAGALSQQEPLEAEVELAHLEHRKVTLATDRDVLLARINTLLHRSYAAPLPPPPKTLPPPDDDTLLKMAHADVDHLAEVAVERRPELTMAAAEIRSRRAAVELAGLEHYPDFGVSSSYNSMWNDEQHRWMIGASINLPIWRARLDAAETEARAKLMQAEHERQRRIDDARSDVKQTAARLVEMHHIVDLYLGRLLPAARDQVQAARSGFETGRGSFLTLIDAERNERAVQLSYQEALADFYRRHAELTRLLGGLPGTAFVPTAPSTPPITHQNAQGELQ